LTHSLTHPDLIFSIFSQRLKIRCDDNLLRALVLANYAAFQEFDGKVDIEYTVSRPVSGGFFLYRGDDLLAEAQNDEAVQYSFLYALEKSIAIDLQYARADLYFIHAAALEHHGRVFMLVAASGTGKSTTAWALLQHGFHYMSDELAPIDPIGNVVHPYPHALCLKSEPPAPYQLPKNIVCTERTIHIPVETIPSLAIKHPRPLQAIFFLQRDANVSEPSLKRLSAAEASTRLYANTLNALAHPYGGLDVAINIASSVPVFLLNAGDLRSTCDLVLTVADDQSILPGATAPLS